MTKHIAYLCADPGIPVYGNKGASIHVQNIIRALLRAGHRVTLFANRIDGATPPGLEGVHLVPLPAPPKGDQENRARALLAARDDVVATIAAHAPYDLIYERYSLWSDSGVQYAENAHIPAVLEVNAPLIDEQRTHRELVLPAEAEAIAASNFARARELIAVSPGVAAYLKNWLPAFVQGSNRAYLTVGIGCTGGQHRSVYVTEQIAALLKPDFPGLHVEHRDRKSHSS